MIPAVIVSHGELGDAYMQALAGIYGETGWIESISNTGLSAAGLQEKVAEALDRAEGPVILLVDYFGGSCATACLEEQAKCSGAYLVSGVNLPILLYYLAHRGELSAPELVAGMVERGRSSVRELGPRPSDG